MIDKIEQFADHRKALDSVALSENTTLDVKKTLCLQSIAHSLIDVSELLFRILGNMK